MSITLNKLIDLFEEIVEKHHILRGFGFGNIFEINGELKPGIDYPVLWVVPIESITTEFTKQRRFLLLVASLVKEDQSNRDQVWSDCEQALDDVIKILRNESNDYDLIGEPSMNPVTEQHGDWITGWQAEIVIETEFNSNYCDIPMDDMSIRNRTRPVVTITNQETGAVIAELVYGQSYPVIVASGIDEGGSSQTYTIQVVDI